MESAGSILIRISFSQLDEPVNDSTTMENWIRLLVFWRVTVFHVVVMPPVIAALRGFLQGERELLVKVLNRLYPQLEYNADRYRNRRDPEDQDLFFYDLQVGNEEDWRTLRFSVDDRQATGYLFVVAVSYGPGRLLI